MDRVRLGRVLGAGARNAMRTAAQAVDAATAPSPQPSAPQPSAPPPPSRPAAAQQRPVTPQPTVISRQTTQRVSNASKNFATGAFAPLRRLSGVLWLEIMGSFFGLFALTFAASLWRIRSQVAYSASRSDHQHFLVYTAMMLMFAYFCVSSFLRARRRDRN